MDFVDIEWSRSGNGSPVAEVFCGKTGRRQALTLCDHCPDCAHVSRTSSVRDWLVVCGHPHRLPVLQGVAAE